MAGQTLKKTIVAVAVIALPVILSASSLSGSKSSLKRQNSQASSHDFTFLRNSSHVSRFVNAGLLERLNGNSSYKLKEVSYPYARPEVKLFVERLSSQYASACGEPLIVTSLTRPLSKQPWNASDQSVHPTGMAVDLRRSSRRSCRSWIEGVLLSLEGEGVLEATKERNPAHYHVALFPNQYARYVDRITKRNGTWRVRSGDTLWQIARESGTSVAELRNANGLRSNSIREGQILKLPSR